MVAAVALISGSGLCIGQIGLGISGYRCLLGFGECCIVAVVVIAEEGGGGVGGWIPVGGFTRHVCLKSLCECVLFPRVLNFSLGKKPNFC